MPAKSPDADHAAFYSATSRPAGETRFETGTVTVGFRDGQPFFHCHAVWTEADGRRGCGHVLPDETMIASPIQVRGAGIIGARFEVHPDRETGYSLLAPVATGRVQPSGARRAIALRLAPNQDITAALEEAGARAGFDRAEIAGRRRQHDRCPFHQRTAHHGLRDRTARPARRRSAVTGLGRRRRLTSWWWILTATIGEGRLEAADNPVLITFEGLLQQA